MSTKGQSFGRRLFLSRAASATAAAGATAAAITTTPAGGAVVPASLSPVSRTLPKSIAMVNIDGKRVFYDQDDWRLGRGCRAVVLMGDTIQVRDLSREERGRLAWVEVPPTPPVVRCERMVNILGRVVEEIPIA